MPIIKKNKSKNFKPFHGDAFTTPTSSSSQNIPPSSQNMGAQISAGGAGGLSSASSGSSQGGGSMQGGSSQGSGSMQNGTPRINPCKLCLNPNISIQRSTHTANIASARIFCGKCGLGIERHAMNSVITDKELIDDWNKL